MGRGKSACKQSPELAQSRELLSHWIHLPVGKDEASRADMLRIMYPSVRIHLHERRYTHRSIEGVIPQSCSYLINQLLGTTRN